PHPWATARVTGGAASKLAQIHQPAQDESQVTAAPPDSRKKKGGPHGAQYDRARRLQRSYTDNPERRCCPHNSRKKSSKRVLARPHAPRRPAPCAAPMTPLKASRTYRQGSKRRKARLPCPSASLCLCVPDDSKKLLPTVAAAACLSRSNGQLSESQMTSAGNSLAALVQLHCTNNKLEFAQARGHILSAASAGIAARYDKAHMFDVQVPGERRRQSGPARQKLLESRYTKPGDKSGAGHWSALLRARAIETQCWLVAAAQAGSHNPRRHSYGHACIIDPWGKCPFLTQRVRRSVRTGSQLASRCSAHQSVFCRGESSPNPGQHQRWSGPRVRFAMLSELTPSRHRVVQLQSAGRPLAASRLPHVHIHVLPRLPGDFQPNDSVYTALEAEPKPERQIENADDIADAIGLLLSPVSIPQLHIRPSPSPRLQICQPTHIASVVVDVQKLSCCMGKFGILFNSTLASPRLHLTPPPDQAQAGVTQLNAFHECSGQGTLGEGIAGERCQGRPENVRRCRRRCFSLRVLNIQEREFRADKMRNSGHRGYLAAAVAITDDWQGTRRRGERRRAARAQVCANCAHTGTRRPTAGDAMPDASRAIHRSSSTRCNADRSAQQAAAKKFGGLARLGPGFSRVGNWAARQPHGVSQAAVPPLPKLTLHGRRRRPLSSPRRHESGPTRRVLFLVLVGCCCCLLLGRSRRREILQIGSFWQAGVSRALSDSTNRLESRQLALAQSSAAGGDEADPQTAGLAGWRAPVQGSGPPSTRVGDGRLGQRGADAGEQADGLSSMTPASQDLPSRDEAGARAAGMATARLTASKSAGRGQPERLHSLDRRGGRNSRVGRARSGGW
uniref:CN hydrolase domain-containing protein n=1 Tax=Macrostomum lignano TaxID=282301 RepID=A0A1I8FQ26_9PLAT